MFRCTKIALDIMKIFENMPNSLTLNNFEIGFSCRSLHKLTCRQMSWVKKKRVNSDTFKGCNLMTLPDILVLL